MVWFFVHFFVVLVKSWESILFTVVNHGHPGLIHLLSLLFNRLLFLRVVQNCSWNLMSRAYIVIVLHHLSFSLLDNMFVVRVTGQALVVIVFSIIVLCVLLDVLVAFLFWWILIIWTVFVFTVHFWIILNCLLVLSCCLVLLCLLLTSLELSLQHFKLLSILRVAYWLLDSHCWSVVLIWHSRCLFWLLMDKGHLFILRQFRVWLLIIFNLVVRIFLSIFTDVWCTLLCRFFILVLTGLVIIIWVFWILMLNVIWVTELFPCISHQNVILIQAMSPWSLQVVSLLMYFVWLELLWISIWWLGLFFV